MQFMSLLPSCQKLECCKCTTNIVDNMFPEELYKNQSNLELISLSTFFISSVLDNLS